MGKIGPVDINIMAGYTFIDPKFQDFNSLQQTLSSSTENILKYRSRHNVKFDIEAFFLKKNNLSVGFSLNYNSSVQAIDRVFQDLILSDNSLAQQPPPLDAFGVGRYRKYVNDGSTVNLGARIGYRQSIVNKEGKELLGLKFSIVGKNMLNQEYNIRPGLVGAPMNITIRLDVEF
jgi:iron complex outermembrane receptor protein